MARFRDHLVEYAVKYRPFFSKAGLSTANCRGYLLSIIFLSLFIIGTTPSIAQDKTHSRKLEKVKTKKTKKKKDKKAAQYQGKIDPTATPSIKGNPTKKSRKTSGKNYQERIGNDEPPRGSKGTKFAGKRKQPKSIERSKGTRHRGDPVPTEPGITGNPTKKQRTSGARYQERIGNNEPPRGTKGTGFRGRGRPKSVKAGKGTNYRGDEVPQETSRVKGNPTKKIDRKGKDYLERTQQGPPTNTPGTRFAGRGRPKTIKGGNDGTTYEGQSTTGSTSNAGGRTTIYGDRGRNFDKSGVPEIKRREQGAMWQGNLKNSKSIEGTPGTQFRGNLKGNKVIAGSPGSEYQGNLKGNKVIEGTPGTQFRGNLKLRKKQVYDYGGDWAGDLKVKNLRPDTRASTYTIKGMRPKQIAQGPGSTYQGDLKVKRNPKIKTPGTTYAGDLRVNPNAKVKTPGTTFAGHYKVSTSRRIKTEGTDYQGDFKIQTRFFKNRYYRQKSREQQLFAGNYKVRRNKGKDLHPSATYSGGRLKDPNKRDDLSRKWKLLLAKTQKNADQPKHLKIKEKKPKYDPGEKDLWYD